MEGFEVDTFWPDARLVVELQSYAHHSDHETFERDHAKLAQLKIAGLEVLPLTYRQITRDSGRTAGVVRALIERAAPSANL